MTQSNSGEIIFELGYRLGELRRQFGAQPWLTVVSGITAEGYRLAGMTAEEFAALIDKEVAEERRLNLSKRRKAIMKLRKGFDDATGSITVANGMAHLNLHFGSGSYREDAGIFSEGPILSMPIARTSLLLTGGCNRPVSRLGVDLPRCLRAKSTKGAAAGRVPGRAQMEMHVNPHFETLALMPEDVAKRLGVDPQRTLDQLPWFNLPTPVREFGTEVRPVVQPQTTARPDRPALRLVSPS